MIVAERCLFQLLSEYKEQLKELKDERPIPPEVDIIAFAILHLTSCYGDKLQRQGEVLQPLKICKELGIENAPAGWANDWKEADNLALTLAQAIIEKNDFVLSDGFIPYNLLLHHKSSVRAHSFNAFWFAKKHVVQDMVVEYLLKDIADTLGYVDEAAGLARSFYDSDSQFLLAAHCYEPVKEFSSQYEERLKKLEEEGNLQSYQELFLPLELQVRALIEKTAMLIELPTIATNAVQLDLLPTRTTSIG